MKILFVMRHSGYVRNFEWVLRLLAERGHRIHLGFELQRPQAELAERLERDTNGAITHGYVPIRDDVWRPLALSLRQGIDYLRYVKPAYRDASKLRFRATRGAPKSIVRATRLRPFRSAAGLAVLDRVLRAWERRIPEVDEIREVIRAHAADMLWATPLVAGHSQHDYVRAAKALGIPVVLPVNSWDNLTNKGLIQRPFPDRTYVWNEAQRREAIDFHGVPESDVVAVGAHTYDHWFEWRPSLSREEFCARVGLDPSRPYVLYLCSSGFIAGDERPIVKKWVEWVQSSPDLAGVGILVRPHPAPGRAWADNPLEGLPNVSVYPPIGADPRDAAARAEYYDSIFHSVAAVGVNTSALIEAAIVGRRTYTVLLPELRETQQGTLHFHHLLTENGGPLCVASSPQEHLAQLAAAIEAAGDEPDWSRPFLESFIRPFGLDVAGAPRFVEAIESLARDFEPSLVQPGRSPVTVLTAPIAHAMYRAQYGTDRPVRGVRLDTEGKKRRKKKRPLSERAARSARTRVKRGRSVARKRTRQTVRLLRAAPARLRSRLGGRLTGRAVAVRRTDYRDAANDADRP